MAEFSQKFQNFSSSFSESNLKNQSGRFSALQEEKLEQQRSDNLSNKFVKKHQDMVECLGRVARAAPRSKKT